MKNVVHLSQLNEISLFVRFVARYSLTFENKSAENIKNREHDLA